MKKTNKDELLDDFDIFDDDDTIDFGTTDETESLSEFEIEDTAEEAESEEIEETEDIEPEEEEETVSIVDNSKENSATPNKDSEEAQTEEAKTFILYIITDKKIPGMLGYFRSYGVKVSKVFNNIDEARDTMLMQVEPSRLIILDTGTGRFTTMSARKSLIDLMGICDEDAKISVFFTDTIIKSEVQNSEEVEDKPITWHKYRSTADVLATILQNKQKENYIYDSDEENQTEEKYGKDILNVKGLSAKFESVDIGLPIITPGEILTNMINNDTEEGEIPGYKIKI